MSENISAKVPSKLKEKAKKYGVNISEVARKALEEQVREIEKKRLKQKMKELEKIEEITKEDVVKAVRETREEN